MSIETCKQDDTHLPAVVAERVVTKISAGAISPEENELIWFSRGWEPSGPMDNSSGFLPSKSYS